MLLSLMIDYLRKQMSMVLHLLSFSDGWSTIVNQFWQQHGAGCLEFIDSFL